MVEVAYLVELVQAPAIDHDLESLGPLLPVDDLVWRLLRAGGTPQDDDVAGLLALAHSLLACLGPLLLGSPVPPVELGEIFRAMPQRAKSAERNPSISIGIPGRGGE